MVLLSLKMKSIFVLAIFSVATFAQVINAEEVTFDKVVKAFNTKCTEHKVPVKSLDFMVKIAPNVEQIQHDLKVPMHQFMNEEKITSIIGKTPDKMTIMKMKLETGARDFIHSVIDSINTEQTAIEKLSNEVAVALASEHCGIQRCLDCAGEFKVAFNHWAADKHTSVEHLKKVEKSVDSMHAYYNKLHATFEKEIAEAKNAKSSIQQGMDSANAEFNKLEALKPTPEAKKSVKDIVEEARQHMSKVTENQAKMHKHLNAVKVLVADYNTQRTEWAEFMIGKIDSIHVPAPEHVDEIAKLFHALKI